MSSTYRVGPGDTFETASRRAYGSAQHAGTIAGANPGVSEPLTVGSVLVVPALPLQPPNASAGAPSQTQNEVAVLVDGKRFRFWSDLRLARSLDAMDTLEFSAPFEADAPGFREAFRPFSFKPVTVTVGGAVLFTGTMVGVSPSLSPDQKSISVSCYSRPGVLNDCTAPASAYPVEFNGQALPAIASALCGPFGLAVEFTAPAGPAFERVAAKPGAKVLSFLSDLARQRSLVISSTPEGRLLFQQSAAPSGPAAILRQGESPLVGVSPMFSPQQYYSDITGLEAVVVGTRGSQYTVKNPHLAGVLRPLTFESPDVQGGDIKDAVAAKAGRMYGNMVSYSVLVDTWRDSFGDLWKPNTAVQMEAPGAMVYTPYTFILRSVRFSRDGSKESADLDLVLPGSFNGQTPETLPWD